ncbi:hypothetical protein AB0M97_08600 [Streptomyces sp. NPDC051207]|uniref:hypothetical protein n=1 Tax=Streptomyces sp. NPDC051207 TaxID=3154641 RepID=UPI003445DF2B
MTGRPDRAAVTGRPDRAAVTGGGDRVAVMRPVTERVLRGHGERRDRVRAEPDRVRGSLPAPTGRTAPE